MFLLLFIYDLLAQKWQQATVLHESKPQIERGRLVKMAINFREHVSAFTNKYSVQDSGRSMQLRGCARNIYIRYIMFYYLYT